ncbi:MAG TPA: mannose-1-phosphate guanylyltransferase/mannose-6-phosphate isomerase [Burkholderiales bacterium]
MRFVPVILAGGSGSRLWPMSRRLLPKQFLPLVAENTLFQETVLRARNVPGCSAPIIVANAEHRFLAAEQLQAIGVKPGALILEPLGRNTAPAIAAAALQAARADPDALLVVLPSDHLIRDSAAFREAVRLALEAAGQGLLVTFGIAPSRPATGYGYIEAGEPLGKSTFRIRRFVEKPDAEKARALLQQGGYLWNSGMFVFRAGRYLEELDAQQPAIGAAVRRALERAGRDLDFLRLDAEAFAASPSLSVDYGVMEHTKAGAVVRAAMDWSDVGSWSALWEVGAKDAAGNVARGDVEMRDAQGCYAHANSRHVSLLGVRDLVVVETDDALLVAARSSAEQVKEVVERLARENRTEHVSHSRVYRPWGYYESVDAGEHFQVKRLMVLPGHALSLQLHHKRAEHWVVVSGRARVTRGEETLDLERNQSTYIPAEVKHRLENAGDEPLLVVEVQSGAYLGEDDIVRFEDRYRRE